ncbi:homeobox-leucine zipper protein ROC5-like [Canna indica]|uniref:Homeobox-leucine zipper protein ROC5-like n=1 Tax=Canna indica TaxID=4628 RepID=A0AAQ3JZF5_9LILI|nr:homeobox-leucine zipper protein ROC5-like [Canna indica]
MEGQMDMSQMMAGAAAGGRRNNEESPRRDENDSRSGSDNLEAVSDDDTDQEQNSRKKNKRYHRHTPQQIQELEALFKECPHPDEKQRMELSRRLSLESRQVKFWFQNRRTQMKTQIERHENLILRQENDKLRAENMSVRQAMRNPVCNNCSGPAMLGELSLDQQNLRIENARLKEELNRVCALAGKFLGRSVSSMASSSNIAPGIPNSFLELGNRNNGGFDGIPSVAVAPSINAVPDLFPAMANPLTAESERRMLVELALAAMEELLAMAQMKEPLWIPAAGGNGDVLNYEQYQQCFRRTTGILPVGYVSEASRDIGMVNINSQLLVEILMNVNQWAEMFSCIIVKATTTDIISSGVGESRNGALQLVSQKP